LEFLVRAIRQEEEIKEVRKKSSYPFSQTTWYRKIPPKKLLDIINSFSKVARFKINLQKLVAFLYTNNEQIEKEYMKTIPFTIAQKNQIPRSKLNKGCKQPL
jgi:hypothetical protein